MEETREEESEAKNVGHCRGPLDAWLLVTVMRLPGLPWEAVRETSPSFQCHCWADLADRERRCMPCKVAASEVTPW